MCACARGILAADFTTKTHVRSETVSHFRPVWDQPLQHRASGGSLRTRDRSPQAAAGVINAAAAVSTDESVINGRERRLRAKTGGIAHCRCRLVFGCCDVLRAQ